jgi:RNA polymerase subunit RPABC4/transcription elongation factor Spt4
MTEAVQLPLSDRQLMACRECKRVLTRGQFYSEGCMSCGSASMERDEVQDQTTAKFHGFVGLVDARNSWVARIIGRDDAPPGVYAAHIAAEVADADDEDDDIMMGDADGDNGAVDDTPAAAEDDIEALLNL